MIDHRAPDAHLGIARKAKAPIFKAVRSLYQRDHADLQQVLDIDGIGHPAMHMPTDLARSEEHTSELQSLMRISYAVFCLKNKKQRTQSYHHRLTTNSYCPSRPQ